jgi:hypothetical protein
MFCQIFRRKQRVEAAKTPHNHHHFHRHHHRFCPPCCRRKKLTLIAPPNNDKCLGGQFLSQLHLSPTQRATAERASPAALVKFLRLVRDHDIPYWGQNCVVWVLKLADGEPETFLLGLCLPFQPSHSVCHTRISPWFNLPFTTAFIAPRSITLKTAAIHPTSSISSPPQKASPPVMQSCLLPPPWHSCSQAAAAWPCPLPQTSCRIPAGATPVGTTPATPTTLGLTTGKATGQVMGHQAASLTSQVTT